MSLMPEDVEGWKNFQSHYSQFGKMDKLYQSLRNDLTSDSFEEIVDDPFKADMALPKDCRLYIKNM